MELKGLIKRGAVLAAANWETIAIQFVAKTTFQALLAVPLVGAALLVAVLLGADVAHLLQGSIQQIFRGLAAALMSQPVALAAFVVSFVIVLFGGSILMFLVRGGTMEVLVAAAPAADALDHQPLAWHSVRSASRFTIDRFVLGCRRFFARYVRLGLLRMGIYAVSVAVFLGFVLFAFQSTDGRNHVLGWTLAAALSFAALALWITVVNLLYLLTQITIAVEDVGVFEASRIVARLLRTSARELGGVFLVMLLVLAAATFASALAWSGVGLIAFVPLIGLAVIPLQLGALLVRGLAFEYIGLTAAGAYVAVYRRHSEARCRSRLQPAAQGAWGAPSGGSASSR